MLLLGNTEKNAQKTFRIVLTIDSYTEDHSEQSLFIQMPYLEKASTIHPEVLYKHLLKGLPITQVPCKLRMLKVLNFQAGKKRKSTYSSV